MISFCPSIITRCQKDLKEQGYFTAQLELDETLRELANQKKLIELDHEFETLTQYKGGLRDFLNFFCEYTDIEYIVSYRSGDNPDEEDGIWHDDGSRKLAYTISLTTEEIEGGELLIRTKNSPTYSTLPTQSFGTILVFHTGQNGFEHKVSKVKLGDRIITAGWLT